MGILTDKVKVGLSELATTFGTPLGDFLGTVIGHGVDNFMKILGKSYAPKIRPLVDALEKTGLVPPELQPLLDEVKSPTGEVAALLGDKMSGALVGGAVSGILDAFLLPMAYFFKSSRPNVILGPKEMIVLWQKGVWTDAYLKQEMRKHGYEENVTEGCKLLVEVLFPTDLSIPLWLRDNDKYSWALLESMRLGLDTKHMEALIELAHKIPGAQDVIRYAVKEAYSPEIYKAFGQDAEFPTEALEDAGRAGIREDYLLKEWIAHWELPGVTQGYSMLHRGLVTKEQLQLLLKARDIMPFWRDKLIGLSYDLPNRIELRMMARYGLIDKPKLIEILLKGGVDPQYVDLLADMNLAIGLITDLRTRYANGYITAEEIRAELVAAGLSAEIQERLYQYIVKVVKPERTAAEKNLTKAEIIKGVKVGIITWEEGVAQLMALGYDEAEAMYILAINIEVAAGSPHNLGDFKRLTDLARAAQGLPTDRTPAEIAASEAAAAAKYPVKAKLSAEEVKTRVDTTRRRRRRGELTRDQEVTELLAIGLDISLATAYAENDDLRLQKGVGE